MSDKNTNINYDLELPVISNDLPPSILSVDEVRKWIEKLYPDLFNRELYEKEKKRMSVNVVFKL